MSTEQKDQATRASLTRMADALLEYYRVSEPPVPVEQMLDEPPQGVGPIDPSKVSVILEHGLYSYEPRLAMARLLCREIVRKEWLKDSSGMDRQSLSYAHLKYFARCLLMPADWIRALREQGLSVAQMSEYLQVPSHAVVTRLAELSLSVPETD